MYSVAHNDKNYGKNGEVLGHCLGLEVTVHFYESSQGNPHLKDGFLAKT